MDSLQADLAILLNRFSNLLRAVASPSFLKRYPTPILAQIGTKWHPQLLHGYRAFQSTKKRYKASLITTVLLLLYIVISLSTSSRAYPSRPDPLYHNPTAHLPHIPPNIWQIHLDSALEPSYTPSIESWLTRSPAYTYTLLDAPFAATLMARLALLPAHAHLVPTYNSLARPAMRAAFLSYLMLALEGGVYSDMTTSVLRPIREWVPEEMREQARAIVGIGYDARGGRERWGVESEVQFCQWTVAAARGHGLMWAMVDGVVGKVARRVRKGGEAVEWSDRDVLDVTGPAGWTEEVFRYLSKVTGRTVTWRDVTGLKEPKLFGDVLVLPINGFGTGQEHSGSVKGVSGDALVQHHFMASLRKDG
jgi:alpha 1,6-mannosyltransferase